MTFALRARRAPGECPVKQAEPQTEAGKTMWVEKKGSRKFEQFSRIIYSLDWKDVGADACQWMMKMDEFVKCCIKSPGFFQKLITISKI